MRIWFIHPKYYDKKGLLAQWNEGLILKNIIYKRKHNLTLKKLKSKKEKLNSKLNTDISQKEKTKTISDLNKIEKKEKQTNLSFESGEYSPIGWTNHPHSKRITRYNKVLQKEIINTYLYYLSEYGITKYNIKFNREYVDLQYVNLDSSLKIPILFPHIEKDYIDLLDKMIVRDEILHDNALKIDNIKEITLLEPFYFTENIEEYLNSLDDEYIISCNNNYNKLIGIEIILNENIYYETSFKKYDFDGKGYNMNTYSESESNLSKSTISYSNLYENNSEYNEDD